MKKFFILFIIIFIFVSLNLAEETWTGRTGGDLLMVNPSTTSMALGGGYFEGIKGVETTSVNPAGLTGIKRREVSFSHVEMFDGFRVEYLGYAQKFKFLYISLDTKGYFYKIDKIDSSEVEQGESTIYSIAPSAGVAMKIKNLSIGFSTTVLYENFGEIDGEKVELLNYAFNGGVQMDLFDERIKIGGSVRNISNADLSAYENTGRTPMPLTGNAGISYIFKNAALKNKLIISANIEIPYDKEYVPIFSAEYMVRDWLKLRGGYRLNEDYEDELHNISFGLGIYESIKKIDGSLEYAYYSFGELGGTHRISYSINW